MCLFSGFIFSHTANKQACWMLAQKPAYLPASMFPVLHPLKHAAQMKFWKQWVLRISTMPDFDNNCDLPCSARPHSLYALVTLAAETQAWEQDVHSPALKWICTHRRL